ncbi:unnamed protein product [Arabidopsis thaliana]|uniref:RNase H type-1 domain-containing protein n=1 Tax=Arabidopsis thaliana TaxID=3702 RepID=A0A5S9YAF3_ARATH|nr:unnamed protein product [Arabidopsis thaliana]
MVVLSHGVEWCRGMVRTSPIGLGALEQETIQKAIHDAKDWQKAQEPSFFRKTPRLSIPKERLAQSHHLVIHSDAGWAGLSRCAGLGWTFTLEGCLFKKNSTQCDSVLSPLSAKALAVRAALLSAYSLGYQDIILYSDCQVLTSTIIWGSSNSNRIADFLAKDALICNL